MTSSTSGSIYDGGAHIFELLHLLVHADDATIIASSRFRTISKLKSLLEYCKLNCIIPQFTKCEFLVVNGTVDDQAPIPFGNTMLENVEHILLLGSHLTSSASLPRELELHMNKRFKSVIKFYNYIRANKLAPLSVKLKVLKACVLGSLLHNCETFGKYIPKELESVYNKMLKCCLNVRSNTPNYIAYIESGCLPIRAVIMSRQWKFYKRFLDTVASNSRRKKTFSSLLQNKTEYLSYYENLYSKYDCAEDIISEFRDTVKEYVIQRANTDHYKFKIYLDINPDLNPSPFLHIIHPLVNDIVKFRLGSHYLPIETGRWNRTPRQERLCQNCNILGDERHAIYECSLIDRQGINLHEDISMIWQQASIYTLFKRIKLFL